MSERIIDAFDATLGNLTGLPDGLETKPSTIQALLPIVGLSQTFIVQTIRHDGGDTCFLQYVSSAGTVRLVLPSKVTALIASQRDALTARARRRGAQKALTTRRERGDTIGNPAALAKARKAKKVKR